MHSVWGSEPAEYSRDDAEVKRFLAVVLLLKDTLFVGSECIELGLLAGAQVHISLMCIACCNTASIRSITVRGTRWCIFSLYGQQRALGYSTAFCWHLEWGKTKKDRQQVHCERIGWRMATDTALSLSVKCHPIHPIDLEALRIRFSLNYSEKSVQSIAFFCVDRPDESVGFDPLCDYELHCMLTDFRISRRCCTLYEYMSWPCGRLIAYTANVCNNWWVQAGLGWKDNRVLIPYRQMWSFEIKRAVALVRLPLGSM